MNIKKQLELSEDWPEVKAILETLFEKGFQAVLAGGAIRDALLKKTPKDMDIATSAHPEEVLKLIPDSEREVFKIWCCSYPFEKQ